MPARALAQATPQFEHRWAGLVFDAFSFDGVTYWTCEDGARIRKGSTAAGTHSFQTVDGRVKDILRRVHVVPDLTPPDTGPKGWAVGFNGWIVKTTNATTGPWNVLPNNLGSAPDYQVPEVIDVEASAFEELWDVHFLDESRGWLLGLRGMWYTNDGGSNWTRCTLKMQDGVTFFSPTVTDAELLEEIEFYALDVVYRQFLPGGPGGLGDGPAAGDSSTSPLILGMAAAEPGLVFKTTDGVTWQVVFDIRCLCASPCAVCYDCASLPPIGGSFGPRPCEAALCVAAESGEGAAAYEAWDIEISRKAPTGFAVVTGGIGTHCGMTFTTSDSGVNWTKEAHECDAGPCTGPLYEDVSCGDPSYNTHVYRHVEMYTQYGVGIQDGDNSAITSGYGGQVLVRNATTAVWADRSQYNNRIQDVPNAVTLPLLGATADGGSGVPPTGKAIVVGFGGFVRSSSTGGQTWESEVHGEPWRIKDIEFTGNETGWQGGQFTRLAKTTDGGTRWTHAVPPGIDRSGPQLLSIAFRSGGLRGVAVGKVSEDTDGPVIYSTTNDGGRWDPPTTIAAGLLGNLLDVTWSGDTTGTPVKSHFWAAGEKGSILRTRDSGVTWTQFTPSSGISVDLTLNGVAFRDLTKSVFVGRGPEPLDTMERGVAYFYDGSTAPPGWTSISPSGTSVIELSDVAIYGDTAYAVGDRILFSPRRREGVVLTSTYSGGVFGTFTIVTGTPTFHECKGNDLLDDIVDTPILIEAEFVRSGSSAGDLWVGGQCGRVWRRSSGGTWTEFKSQTDTNILGISIPSSSRGYFGGLRKALPQHALVRFTQ